MKIFKKKQPVSDTVAANAERTARGVLNDSMPEYDSYYYETKLTPQNINSALEDYRTNRKLQGLSNVIELLMDVDDNLQSALDVRKAAVKAATWSYGVEMSKDRQEFYDNILNKYLPKWIDSMVDGKMLGWQFHQIMYDLVDGAYLPIDLVEYSNLDLRIVKRKLVLFDRDRPVELPEYKFLNILYKRPKLHSVLKYYVFFSHALNNWGQFVETYGKPLRLGTYDQSAQPSEVNVLRAAVKGLGTDQAAVISDSTKIEFKDFASKDKSADLFQMLLNFVSDRVTKKVLGQTLTTNDGNGTGSYALAKVHDMVRQDIVESDVADLPEFVNAILDYVDAINFGGSGVKAWFEIHNKVDLAERIAIDEKIVGLGVPVSEDHFYDTYGIDRPTSGQKIVSGGVAMAPNADGVYVPEEKALTPALSQNGRGRLNAGDPPVAPTVPDEGSNPGDGQTRRSAPTVPVMVNSTVLKSEIAKHLSEMQGRIRACASLKEVREIDRTDFIAGIGGEIAKDLVNAYVVGRKKKQHKTKNQANNAGLFDIRWEWDEESVEAAHAFRNQAMILTAVRSGESFETLISSITKLLEEGGNFTDFIAQADLAGFAPDNPYQLKTEYETALASAEIAGRWDEIEATKALFPFLKYVTMNDELVRDEHAALDGTIAAVDDAFWDENMPPNGYNCRCTVEQLMQEEAEEEPKYGAGMPVSSISDEFKGNVGKTRILPGNLASKLGKYGVNSEVMPLTPNPSPTRGEGSHVNAEMTKDMAFDYRNYPVMMPTEMFGPLSVDEVKAVLKSPTEVWQNGLFESAFISKNGNNYMTVQVYKGKVWWSEEGTEMRRNYGVRER